MKRFRHGVAALALSVALFANVQKARAEPISAFIIGAIGLGGTATGAFLTPILTAAIGVGVSLGLSAIGSLFQRKNRPKADPSQYLTTISNTVEPLFFAGGRTKMAALRSFSENRGGFLYIVDILGYGTIDAIEEVYLNGRLLLLDTDNCVTNKPWLILSSRPVDSRSYVRIEVFRGFVNQPASAILQAAFPTEWTSSHIGRGIAYVVWKIKHAPAADYQKLYGSQIPERTYLMRGARVFDPRDPAQVLSNPDTWLYSDNSALLVLYVLLVPLQISAAVIDLPSFAAAADLCDEFVPLLSGGVERRYRFTGRLSYGSEPRDNLSAVLSTCRGRLSLTGDGKIRLRVGAPQAPTVTVNDDMRVASIEVTRGGSMLTRYNAIRAQYVSEPHGWSVQTAARQSIAANLVLDGRVIEEATDLSYVPSHAQAQRLSKFELYEENPDFRGELLLNARGLQLLDEESFILDDPMFGTMKCRLTSMTFEADDSGMLSGIRVGYESIADVASAWVPATDEGPAPVVPPSTSEDPTVPGAPVNFTVVVEGAAPPYSAALSANPTTRAGDVWDIWYRVSGATEWDDVTGLSVPATVIGGLTSATAYDAQIRVRTSAGGVSSWTALTFVATPFSGVTLAPPGISGIAAGVENVDFTLTQSVTPEAYWLEWAITAVGGTPTFTPANRIALAPGQTRTFLDVPVAAGSRVLHARALSPLLGTVSATTASSSFLVAEQPVSSGGGGGGGSSGPGTVGGSGGAGTVNTDPGNLY
jgi:hypothetical protein